MGTRNFPPLVMPIVAGCCVGLYGEFGRIGTGLAGTERNREEPNSGQGSQKGPRLELRMKRTRTRTRTKRNRMRKKRIRRRRRGRGG